MLHNQIIVVAITLLSHQTDTLLSDLRWLSYRFENFLADTITLTFVVMYRYYLYQQALIFIKLVFIGMVNDFYNLQYRPHICLVSVQHTFNIGPYTFSFDLTYVYPTQYSNDPTNVSYQPHICLVSIPHTFTKDPSSHCSFGPKQVTHILKEADYF